MRLLLTAMAASTLACAAIIIMAITYAPPILSAAIASIFSNIIAH